MTNSQEKRQAEIPSDLQRALDKFRDETQIILSEELKGLLESPVPPVMYHYTSDIGLRGIINSGNLWLTDMFSLNDPSELIHGISLAAGILAEKAEGEGKRFEREFASQFGNNLKGKFRNSAHYFCCSFSEAGDDLGQWRAYADNGNGYALGFDGEKLKAKYLETFHYPTFRVAYDEQLLRSVHEKIIEKFLLLLSERRSIGFRTKVELRHIYMELERLVIASSLYFKHPGYGNEREYRFLKLQKIADLNRIMYRPRNYQLIKYLEFNWNSTGPRVLKKIVIGPAADYKQSRQFAEDCLRACGIDMATVEITQSEIPYRSA